MTAGAARALRHLASARGDIVQKNIPGAQSELARVLILIDDMKSTLPTGRVQELIAVARIHLTYEDPKQVLAYLESIAPALAAVQETAISRPVKRSLERAKELLRRGEKESADRELAAAGALLSYQTTARPLALIEKHILAAKKELENHRPESADGSSGEAEQGLKFIAIRVDTPLYRTTKSLWRATLHSMAGRWAAAQAELARASAYLQQAAETSTAEGRAEIKDLSREVKALLEKSSQGGELFGRSIKGIWRRSESLAERALDYQSAALQKFQSSSPGAVDLVEAKLHVAYAETYEFTTGEKQKSEAELEKAQSYVKRAEPQMSGDATSALEKVEDELTTAKTEVGKNQPGQRERYLAIRDSLSRLID